MSCSSTSAVLPVLRRLSSRVDGSVNHVARYGSSVIECRYVRRSPDVISVYVSSHNGCKMKCQFCWLTAQQQHDFTHVDIPTYQQQVATVLNSHIQQHESESRDKIRININLMSRGEALANKHIVSHYDQFYDSLHELVVRQLGYHSMKINLSTIMPYTIRDHTLSHIFKHKPVNLYYSLYSMSPAFRQKWIPNAISPTLALDKLKQLQTDYFTHHTQQQLSQQHAETGSSTPSYIPGVNFHWSFIANENDNEGDIRHMLSELSRYNFTNNKFNLVRFNPHPSLAKQGYHEPSEEKLTNLFNIIQQHMNHTSQHAASSTSANYNNKWHPSRIIPRAGPDVYASCGMFIDDHDM